MGLSSEVIVGGLPPTMRPIFETAYFAGSKSCPLRSSPSWPEIAEFGTTTNASPQNSPRLKSNILLIKIINNNYYNL